jgi:hypothetical protein
VTDFVGERTADSPSTEVRDKLDQWSSRLVTVVFGDLPGLVLYLGCLVWFGLMWQLGFFINDNFTLANALVNLADGHLAIETIQYGPTEQSTPGMVSVADETYGRAYGVVASGLLVYWLLVPVERVTDISVLLIGAWSVVLYLTVWLGGKLFDYSRVGSIAAGVLAGGAFVVNLTFAGDIAVRWLPMLALQIATMLAAGFVCVFLYRLFARMYDRRVGIAAGLTATLGTPVVFWATVPKRHAFTAALAVTTIYAFYRSRDADSARARLRFRALAYVPAGLTAWIQLADAALLVVPLAVVDLLTASENGVRELTTVAVVGLVSCLPVFITNILISGSPIQSPMLLERSIGTIGSQSASTSSSVPPAFSIVRSALSPLVVFGTFLFDGATRALDPAKTIDVFVRGGYIQEVTQDDGATVRLALLEAAPVVAAVAAVPIQTVRWIRSDREINSRIAVDLLVGGYVLLFAVFYMRFLPWHASVTVRHLLPLYPALVYGVFRLAAIRSVLHEWRLLAGVGTGTAVVGLELFVFTTLVFGLRVGEAAQLLAVGGLLVAVLLAVWVLVVTSRDVNVDGENSWQTRLGAVTLGLAIGWGVMSMLALRLLILAYGTSVVAPALQWVIDLVPLF